MRRIGGWVMAILALAIALYGLRLAIVGERAFVEVLAASFRARPWAIFFHALLSAIALGLGPFQFQRGLLVRHRALRRNLGRVYLVCAFLAAAWPVFICRLFRLAVGSRIPDLAFSRSSPQARPWLPTAKSGRAM